MTQSGFILFFYFQRKMVKYCRNDVDILRRACFQESLFLKHRSVCRFVECMTIASTCEMKVFRRNFLREEEIGIIPMGGYRYKDNYSCKAVQ